MTTSEVHSSDAARILGGDLRSVGVVGGGTMGSGIVHVLLASGVEVTLVESNAAAVDRARRLV